MTENNAHPTTPEEIRAEIESTRAELADTVDQLTDKFDVKAQAQHKVDDVKQSLGGAAHRAKEATPEPVQHAVDRAAQTAQPAIEQGRKHQKQLLIAAAAGLVVLVILRRRGRTA